MASRLEMRPGPRNLITDVTGLKVGNARDDALRSGVTVLTADRPFTAAVHVMGGAPGTRETDLLAPDKLVQQVDALVLSGGSAFGLDAASGVAEGLRAAGRGFPVGHMRVPIVPAAILFDLLSGGDKDWIDNPYGALGRRAYAEARADFALGSEGAGTAATTTDLMGGLGSASLELPGGVMVGALVAVSAIGSVVQSGGPHFWAAPFEFADEFGGLGPARNVDPCAGADPLSAIGQGRSTTIAIVATNASLTQAEATRLAIGAHDGLARAIVPSHTPTDGDLVFAAATGDVALEGGLRDRMRLGHAAAICLSRAVARGVFAAKGWPGAPKPTWNSLFGQG